MPIHEAAATPAPRTHCPSCGYLRHGLSAAAVCPECGWDPADPAPPARLQDDAASHARVVALGLTLLALASFTLLAATLLMRFRWGIGGSLPIVNFPGPKLWAAVLVQRSVGNFPALLGVTGTLTAFQAVVAIWLVTTPRLDRGGESMISLRSITRWVAVLAFGAGFGLLLSRSSIKWWGTDSRIGYYAMLVTFVELPGTVLLYAYLRTLAGPDTRARWLLTVAGIGAGLLLAISAFVLLLFGEGVQSYRPSLTDPAWSVVFMTCGAVAVASGLLAFAGIGRLIWRQGVIGFGPWLRQVRTPAWDGTLLRRVVDGLTQHRATLLVVAGIVLWLFLTQQHLAATAFRGPRAAVLHELPFFNYVGPKVFGTYLGEASNYGRFNRYYNLTSVPLFWTTALTLLAVWMMTGTGGRLRHATRWWPILAIGGIVGAVVAIGPIRNEATRVLSQESKYLLLTTLLCELPATLLLYLHLATLAASHDSGVARGLRRAGWAAASLTGLCVLVALSTLLGDGWVWYEWRRTTPWVLAAAGLGATAAAVSLYGTWQVLRLVVLLLSSLQPSDGLIGERGKD
jgi:hypothetical protein